MKEIKNTIIVIISSILIILGIIIVCAKLENATANKTIDSEKLLVGEWISPDGVHYWYREHGYGIMFAPRYDSSGGLVIDVKGE